MKQEYHEYNRLPKQVSRKEFNHFIAPYLSKRFKGRKPKVSLYKIFNYVLYILSTGCQWREIPIRKNETSWQVVYKWHNRWSKDGSFLNLLEGTVHTLKVGYKLRLNRIHGDATNTVAKKGEVV
jgi:transposase